MTTIEAFTFTPEQFLSLISAIVGIIVAVVGATVWITYKIRGVEKDVEHALTKNPYVKAFRDLEERDVKEKVTEIFDRGFDKTLNTWEAEKKASSSEGEDTSKQ
jgi:hypothetical protein